MSVSLLWWALFSAYTHAAEPPPNASALPAGVDSTTLPPAGDASGASPPSDATDPVPVRAGPAPVRLLYTGAARGIGRNLPPIEVLQSLARDAHPSGAQIIETAGVQGVLAQGPHLLMVDGTMRSAISFLDGQPVTCTPATEVPGRLHSTGRLQLDVGDAAPDWIDGLADDARFRRQVCTHPTGASATLTTDGDVALPSWDIHQWETRDAVAGTLALAGRSVSFLAVRDPVLDHSRTLHAIQAVQQEWPGTTLYVDAGSALDGASSVLDGEPSLHRSTRLQDFQRVMPAVLVPGETELALGATAFIEEQAEYDLPYIASNWLSDQPMRELPASRIVEVDHPDGTVRIAFIGILDPALQNAHAGLAEDGIRITDPITTVQPLIAELEALPEPPHAIVALTTAGGDVQERIRRELRGVDLLLGDPTLATMRTRARDVDLQRLDSAQKGAAVTLPMDGLAVAELYFSSDDQYLERVRTVPVPLPVTAPVDAKATAAITAVRIKHLPQQEVPLVGPPPEGGPLATWSATSWNQMVCEAVRGGANADIVVLDRLPAPPPTPGPVSELQALRQLALPDTLEVHRISGVQIQRLADRLAGLTPVVCGIQPGERVWKVGPRWLEPDRTYRVVTTHRAAATTPIGEILSSLESTRALDRQTKRIVATKAAPGRAVTLRSVALEELRAVRDMSDNGADDVATVLLEQRPTTLDPLWLFRIRRVGIQSTSFSGVENEAFATVPETLATSPSAYTFGSEADLALEFSGPTVLSDLRSVGAFSEVRAGEGEPDELADDLRFSTSHSLPGLAFPTLPALRMMPFSEVAYDTEFTAIEVDEGGTGIKQADLSLTLGISALRTGPIRGLRLGGFVNRDMARLAEKPPEFGGALDWETFQSFGPSVKWTTNANIAVYADTAEDDASDLRLRAMGDTRLLLPLATWLDLGAFGQVFAIRGRIPANDMLGVSTTWGVTLDMAGAFAL